MSDSPAERVLRYHQETKHHLDRYARSPGYLDWDNQPNPFRVYEGVPVTPLPLLQKDPPAGHLGLFEVVDNTMPFDLGHVAGFLELSLGLSAWKSVSGSRWALRMHPSSGNLHPTEAHLVLPAAEARASGVYHYSALHHVLERRAEIPAELWRRIRSHLGSDGFLVGLTSIFWRESWKYGERAFRYCNHDVGHALAALRFAANVFGWRLTCLTGLSDEDVEVILGLRHTPFPLLDEEHPDLVGWVHPGTLPHIPQSLPGDVVTAFEGIRFDGRPNVLSREHVNWEIIYRTAELSRKPSTPPADLGFAKRSWATADESRLGAAEIIRRRRSATDFDRRGAVPRRHFLAMLDKTLPREGTAPFDVRLAAPELDLLVFVHNVTDLEAGLYFFLRTGDEVAEIRTSMRPEFLWQPVEEGVPLYRLSRGDFRRNAAMVSCHQDIAGSSAFSLGMLARFGEALAREPFRYRYRFWESGMIGQTLYLEAEAHGVRGTGIGCFFDDAVHDLLGLETDRYQSVYHFTVGRPLEDPRLATYPPYSHLSDR